MEEDDIFVGTGQVFKVGGDDQFSFDSVDLVLRDERKIVNESICHLLHCVPRARFCTFVKGWTVFNTLNVT